MRILATLLWCDFRMLRRELVLLLGLVVLSLLVTLLTISTEETGQGRFHFLLSGLGVAGVAGLVLAISLLYRGRANGRTSLADRLPVPEWRRTLARSTSSLGTLLTSWAVGMAVASLLLLLVGIWPFANPETQTDLVLYSWALGLLCLLVAVRTLTHALGVTSHGHRGIGRSFESLVLALGELPTLILVALVLRGVGIGLQRLPHGRILVRRALRYVVPLGIVGYAALPILELQLAGRVEPGHNWRGVQLSTVLPGGRHVVLQGYGREGAESVPIVVDLAANEWRHLERPATQIEICEHWIERRGGRHGQAKVPVFHYYHALRCLPALEGLRETGRDVGRQQQRADFEKHWARDASFSLRGTYRYRDRYLVIAKIARDPMDGACFFWRPGSAPEYVPELGRLWPWCFAVWNEQEILVVRDGRLLVWHTEEGWGDVDIEGRCPVDGEISRVSSVAQQLCGEDAPIELCFTKDGEQMRWRFAWFDAAQRRVQLVEDLDTRWPKQRVGDVFYVVQDGELRSLRRGALRSELVFPKPGLRYAERLTHEIEQTREEAR